MGDVDTYKGDSPGKKIARYELWSYIARDVLGVEEFYDPDTRFLVLASREGGDVSVLKSVRVPVAAITAVDLNADAASECRRRHPDLNVVVGNVADVVGAMPTARDGWVDIDVAFLDFCGYLNRPLLDTVSAVANRLRPGSVLAVAFMRGREQSGGRIDPSIDRRSRRALRSRFGMLRGEVDLVAGRTTDPRQALREAKALDGELAHARTLASMLKATSTRSWPSLTKAIHYHSRSRTGGGVPMAIAVFRIAATEIAGNQAYRERARRMNKAYSLLTPLEKQRIHVVTSDWDEEAIRRGVLSGRWDPDPAGVLNIPTATIAAWRAHATRGTYAEVTNG